jgi:hypothetical protein
MEPMRNSVFILILLAAPAFAAFEKGGVLDTDPRTGALGGATAASTRDALGPGANPAFLALLPAPAVSGLGGVASAASLASSGLSGGAVVEGLGIGGSFTQVTGTGAAERTIRAAIGIPAGDLPGAAFGAAVKFRDADFGPAKGTGFGLDLGAVSAVPVPWERLAVSAAAGIEDVLGSLDWTNGLSEPVARQSRLGVSARWAGRTTGLVEARFIRAATRNEELLGLGVEQAFTIRGVALALRAGWRDGSLRKAAATGGLGVGYGPVTVDYAIAGAGAAGGAIHLVSATWAFPGGEPWRSGGDDAAPTSAQGDAAPENGRVVCDSPYATTRIMIHAPKVELVTGWTVLILDRKGAVVWSAEGDNMPPASLTWSGVAVDGTLVPSGEYKCQLVLRGPGTFQYVSGATRFRLIRPVAVESSLDSDGPGGF